jgi:hypothetical protein
MGARFPAHSLVCPNCKGKTQFNFLMDNLQGTPNAPHVGLGQCSVCRAVILAYAGTGEGVIQYYPPPEAWVPGQSGGVPVPIWAGFSEATVCGSVNAFKATAVLCRRAVQGVAVEKGIPKGKPADQVDQMEQKRLITPLLKDTAHQIRVFGNVGAHPGEDGLDVVTDEEADAALVFTEELVDHVYRLPARLAKFKPGQPAESEDSAQVADETAPE